MLKVCKDFNLTSTRSEHLFLKTNTPIRKFIDIVTQMNVEFLDSSFLYVSSNSYSFHLICLFKSLLYVHGSTCSAMLGIKIVSEHDQEIPQSQTADNPVAPRGRAPQPSRDTRKTN